LNAADKLIQQSEQKDKDGKIIPLSQFEIDARRQKEQIVYTGFIAQDVEKSAKELNFDFSGVDAARNDKDLYGLRYAEFVVPLVKAVQEQQAIIEKLQKQVDANKAEIPVQIGKQQQQLEDMKKEIDLLKEQNKTLTQLISKKN